MLADVFVVPLSEVPTRPSRLFGVKRQGIELVIAHHGQSGSLLDHRPDDLEHLANLRSTIDEIANENHLPRSVAIHFLGLLVAQQFEQPHQLVSMPVNVADQVVHVVAVVDRAFVVTPRLLPDPVAACQPPVLSQWGLKSPLRRARKRCAPKNFLVHGAVEVREFRFSKSGKVVAVFGCGFFDGVGELKRTECGGRNAEQRVVGDREGRGSVTRLTLTPSLGC